MSIYLFDYVGTDIVYDILTGQDFKCTEEDFIKHVEKLNSIREEACNKEIRLNEWLDRIGLPGTECGKYVKWPSWKDIGRLDIKLGRIFIGDECKEIRVIEYDRVPGFSTKFIHQYH